MKRTRALAAFIALLFSLTLGLAHPAQASTDGDFSAKIVGGGEAAEAPPWIAALYSGTSFRCTASQIAPEWILTAAHCVDESVTDYSVRIGSLDRTQGGIILEVVEVNRHPDYPAYEDGTLTDRRPDLALLRLAEPYGDTFPELATAEDLQTGAYSTFYGWGATKPDWTELSDVLKYGEGDYRANPFSWEDVYGIFGDEAAVAGGDSGGPALVRSAVSDELVIIGATCCGYRPTTEGNGWAGGWTSVVYYDDWLTGVMNS
ncbi:S1 family peptidase [Salininema proteolyticum]|uniref:S1 family peptidase n=1 Tax=Salininema proteolyticum TaxID=1607685 RepID=A0ABV8U249_9ACTN